MSWLWSSVNSLASTATTMATQSLDKVYEILETPKIDSDDEEGKTAETQPKEETEEEAEKKESETNDAPSDPVAHGLFTSWNTVMGLASEITKSDLMNQTVGFGEVLLNQTLSTLETVGKNTMETVSTVVQEAGLREKKGGEKVENPDKKPTSFNKEFEDRAGTAHLTALEALSNECSSRIKVIIQQLTAKEGMASVKKQLEKEAKALAVFFNVENVIEEIESSSEIRIINEEEFGKLKNLLKEIDVLLLTQIKELQAIARTSEKGLTNLTSNFRRELEELKKQDQKQDGYEEKIAELTKEALKNIWDLAVMTLAKFSSKILEQFLRLSENLLLKISEKRAEGPEKHKELTSMVFAKTIREIAVFLLKDHYSLLSRHAKLIEELN